ncbi:unnamed protein product [Triticum turgidum subsp. durum]|uniref:Homeobox-leucine zipper protein HOX19 n=1 Tax=Triticum turgidum subsp. durum TaxID=4567 RepID=A0A9R0WDS5_TRITD|nr:unnamed protein product [Triticum turgidum subsp. durum]
MPEDTTMTSTASGGVSSMSVGGAVKRERAEEADLGEMVSSTAAGAEEDDDGSTRKKLRLTKEQSALLEDRFKEHSTLNPVQAESGFSQAAKPQAKAGGSLVPEQKSQDEAEADGGGLRVPEALLRDAHRGEPPAAAGAAGAPRHQVRPAATALPAATLTICPSCERLGGTAATAAGKVDPDRPKAATHHFFNPFTHSAAC